MNNDLIWPWKITTKYKNTISQKPRSNLTKISNLTDPGGGAPRNAPKLGFQGPKPMAWDLLLMVIPIYLHRAALYTKHIAPV